MTRAGVGQAQPRAAGGAARGGRRRRRRVRADDHVRGRRRGAARRGPPQLEHHAPAQITHPEHASSTYRFCTNFAVTGTGLSAGRFIAPLEALGDSVLVVGDANTLKVHVHTDEPERATERVRRRGRDLAAGHRRHARAGGRARRAPGTAPRASRARTARARPNGAARPRRRATRACAAERWRSSAATGCGRCSRSSACTRSTAARR